MLFTKEDAEGRVKEATRLYSELRQVRNCRNVAETSRYLDLGEKFLDLDGPYHGIEIKLQEHGAKITNIFVRRWELLSLIEDGYLIGVTGEKISRTKAQRSRRRPRLHYIGAATRLDKANARREKGSLVRWKRILREATYFDDKVVARVARAVLFEGSSRIVKEILQDPSKIGIDFSSGNPFVGEVLRQRIGEYVLD